MKGQRNNIVSAETVILLYDGTCNLCNGLVRFIIKRDPARRFRFGSLQSESGKALLRKLGLPLDDLNSVVMVAGEKYYLKSSAGLRVLKELGGVWKLFYFLMILPAPFRDFVYDIVAKTRYMIFGKQESCQYHEREIGAGGRSLQDQSQFNNYAPHPPSPPHRSSSC